MSASMTTPEQVAAAVQELDLLANTLGFPDQERCGILGLNGDTYRSWQSGKTRMEAPITAELVRRLSYALPLIRRMAAHAPGSGLHDHGRAAPMRD